MSHFPITDVHSLLLLEITHSKNEEPYSWGYGKNKSSSSLGPANNVWVWLGEKFSAKELYRCNKSGQWSPSAENSKVGWVTASPQNQKMPWKKPVKKLVTSHRFWHEFDAEWTTGLWRATCHTALEKFQAQFTAQLNDTFIKLKISKTGYSRHELPVLTWKTCKRCSCPRAIHKGIIWFPALELVSVKIVFSHPLNPPACRADDPPAWAWWENMSFT